MNILTDTLKTQINFKTWLKLIEKYGTLSCLYLLNIRQYSTELGLGRRIFAYVLSEFPGKNIEWGWNKSQIENKQCSYNMANASSPPKQNETQILLLRAVKNLVEIFLKPSEIPSALILPLLGNFSLTNPVRLRTFDQFGERGTLGNFPKEVYRKIHID